MVENAARNDTQDTRPSSEKLSTAYITLGSDLAGTRKKSGNTSKKLNNANYFNHNI